jgi:phenylacetate-CoA ligase
MQAVTLAALQQLEQSQYLPLDELRARQFGQLALLVAHAADKLPFYRDRFRAAGFDPGEPITAEAWARLPILTREEVQSAGDKVRCRDLPRQHGETTTGSTSGSTATALVVDRSAIAIFFWNVFTLREAAWHGFDLSGKLAAIRIDWQRPAGSTGFYVKRHDNWGPPLAALYPTGPAAVLDIRHCTIAEQAQWLRQEAPDHLVSFGVNLKVLARYCLAHGICVPSLKTAYSQGEVLSEAARRACREAWGVEVVDNYSAVEAGQLAFQCPDHPHFHVQSESAVVEILDADGRPCRPGDVGRVVVTPLHKFRHAADPLRDRGLGRGWRALCLRSHAAGDQARAGPHARHAGVARRRTAISFLRSECLRGLPGGHPAPDRAKGDSKRSKCGWLRSAD